MEISAGKIRTGCCLIRGKNAVFPFAKNTIHMVVKAPGAMRAWPGQVLGRPTRLCPPRLLNASQMWVTPQRHHTLLLPSLHLCEPPPFCHEGRAWGRWSSAGQEGQGRVTVSKRCGVWAAAGQWWQQQGAVGTPRANLT